MYTPCIAKPPPDIIEYSEGEKIKVSILPGGKYKYVWNYFTPTRVDGKVVSGKCKKCSEVLKIANYSVTGFDYHLKSCQKVYGSLYEMQKNNPTENKKERNQTILQAFQQPYPINSKQYIFCGFRLGLLLRRVLRHRNFIFVVMEKCNRNRQCMIVGNMLCVKLVLLVGILVSLSYVNDKYV
eukprot:TRINITY_DN65826_c0_g1_i17.p3 TRINITY_DN65826_c0_g1~~TRINITY_DN65826_c0_g1_i17.p3  ORF type:complete len:182 (+),score=10.64 TRINITY_DN65826_c0_g1_i17:157-702(+)